jgi:Ni,Fe-hydrogenase I small subunit
MTRYYLFAGLLGVALWAVPESVSAMQVINYSGSRPVVVNATPQERKAIEQMPLLERPNRPGHFYGNTVRRIHDRRVQRGG